MTMAFPWYTFALLFVLPFVDPRRPLRLLHLDVLVLAVVGLGPLHFYEAGGQPRGSAVVAVGGLAYLAGRLLWIGFHPRGRPERLVPILSLRWLTVALVLVLCLRVGYVVFDPPKYEIDVGIASVAGADRITHGRGIYGEELVPALCVQKRGLCYGDTYGPANYLAYIPFEQLFPWHPLGGAAAFHAPSARAAALTFDLLTLGVLMLLGLRMRPGREGRLLGVALCYAWAAYHYTLFSMHYSFNDGLVALAVLAPFLVLASPGGRGALVAIAAWTKFAPAVLAPLLATGTGDRRLRSTLVYAAAFLGVTLALFLPFIPDGGLRELYDSTVGFQQARPGWSTFWSRFPELDWLRTIAEVGVAALALLLAFVPRKRTPLQLMALGGALILAVQLSAKYWSASYVSWFAPLALIGLFATRDCGSAGREKGPSRPSSRAATAVPLPASSGRPPTGFVSRDRGAG
jgi:hypothetical protein